MIWLMRYWKPLAVLALLALVFAWGYGSGASRESMKCGAAQLQAALAQAKALDAANARADQINETLKAELAKPGSGTVIREIIRENPSDCVLAKPVADGVRDAIRRANEAPG